VLATAMQGDGERAFHLFQLLNPMEHARTPEDVATYKVEPYVVAADVYTAAGQRGRGGWTWYTGSASWMYRVALETILGFTKSGDRLTFAPRVPAAWPELAVEYRHGTATYAIVIERPGEVGAAGAPPPSVTVDGAPSADGVIVLRDDGARHEVVVRPANATANATATARG
jgi:cyclic beta-1,2-glucan synthetase